MQAKIVIVPAVELPALADLERPKNATQARPQGHAMSSSASAITARWLCNKLGQAPREVDNYLRGQRPRLVNYAKQYRAGMPPRSIRAHCQAKPETTQLQSSRFVSYVVDLLPASINSPLGTGKNPRRARSSRAFGWIFGNLRAVVRLLDVTQNGFRHGAIEFHEAPRLVEIVLSSGLKPRLLNFYHLGPLGALGNSPRCFDIVVDPVVPKSEEFGIAIHHHLRARSEIPEERLAKLCIWPPEESHRHRRWCEPPLSLHIFHGRSLPLLSRKRLPPSALPQGNAGPPVIDFRAQSIGVCERTQRLPTG
jgi:hypothetical protein